MQFKKEILIIIAQKLLPKIVLLGEDDVIFIDIFIEKTIHVFGSRAKLTSDDSIYKVMDALKKNNRR